MSSALIGHTGLVGGTLLRQARFTHLYNSKNIEAIAGQAFDLAVCCGAPAEKWRANREPEADWNNLCRLMECLGQARIDKLVLVSTVDVFAEAHGVDEDSPVELTGLGAYGKHRYLLERILMGWFDTLVVRLPGLFGQGLKKNLIYDFLHGNQVERIHSESVYQFYGLDRLWSDVQIALRAGMRLVHFATEPVSVSEVASYAFDFPFVNTPDTPPVHYDFRSKYAESFGGGDGYLYSKSQVLQELRQFVNRERMEKRCA